MTPEQRVRHNESCRRWRERNKQFVAKQNKKWQTAYRKKNRAKVNAYFREYYKKNSKKAIAWSTAWNKRNPEKLRKYRNTPARKEYDKKWKAANPEKVLGYQDKHRDKRRALREAQALHETSQSS